MTEEERDRLLKAMREGKEQANEMRRRTDDKPHRIALWVGIATLLTQLAAIQVVILVGKQGDPKAEALGAIVTAFIVAGAAYAKQRLEDERDKRERNKKSSP